MVKRWIVMIVIALLLVVGGIAETTYTQNTIKWLINSMEMLEIGLMECDKDVNSKELINEIYYIDNEWNRKVKILKCLAWHSGVKDIEIGLARIGIYVKENDKTEALAETESLIDYSSHCLKDFKITLENIL
jgi:hypothetical protein